MHYKYVWRGLEEMFEFAHLHKNEADPKGQLLFFGEGKVP